MTSFPFQSYAPILTALLLCSCQTSPRPNTSSPSSSNSTTTLPTGDYIYGTAIVESVTPELQKSGPTQAKLTIRGLLNDGATTIHKIDQIKIPEGFVITITTARLRTATATLALVPFERVVTLDLHTIRSGPIQIRVNDVRTTLNVP